MKKKFRTLARRSLAVLTLATVIFSSRDADAGPYQLQLRGPTNSVCVVEASSDLQHWTAIATNQVSPVGRLNFNDPQAGKSARRFYRSRQLASSSLSLLGGFSNPAKILVKPKSGAILSGLNLSLGVTVLNTFPKIGNLQIIKVPGTKTASTLIASYRASGLVQYAENDFYVQALNSPDDFFYQQGNLWNLNNIGQNGGTPGADIHATNAWDTITSASNVIVAVVDTGVRYTHEDLAANIWVNPADGSHGTNTIAGSTDPNDDYGHGSHVSGTIGAVGNNSVGVVGVCWNVQIMACKFLDSTGAGTISDAILCIDYARTHGAKVVNASWGAPTFTSQSLHDAIASLRDADIVFVAAAGNSALNNDTSPFYPADYRDLDNVVAVAATDRNDQLASFSDYGVTNVDLAAPGTPIFSCWNGSDSDYQYDDGTSMAAATVSGAIALLRAYYPNDAHRQIIQRMLNGVDPLPSLAGKTISGGRLNLAKALNATSPPPPALTANFSANPTSGQAPLAVQFTDTSTGGPTSWNWNFGDGVTSTTQNPSHTFNSAGNFTVTLAVANSAGQTSSKSSIITATNANTTTLTANFSASPTSGQAPLAVQFTDTSTGNPVSWDWNFGDGSAHGSTQNPAHTFNSAGSYTVTLTVSNSGGNTSSQSGTITATNSTPPPTVTANFSANPGSGQAPLTVQFTDASTGPVTNWNWNFGDGATGSTQNPSHTYSSVGNFTASLTVTGSSGQTSSASHTITVTNASVQPVSANFSANPSSGQAPLAVQFTDQSTGPVTAWNWNFGDGATSSAQNPNHTYSNAGNFATTLAVTGSSGQTSSANHTITVTNAPPPVTASFSANPNSGQAPLTVQFTDQSGGSVVSWNWNFGDGSTSSAQNPSHTYNSAGSFNATLNVTGSSSQTSSTSHAITVTNAPPPPTVTANFSANPSSGQAPLAVQFTDQSTGPVTAWNWNFGDGTTSSTQNPNHTYSSAGSFTATLNVTGSSGQTSSTSHTITVTNAPPPPVTASFSANPSSGQAPLTVQFADQSSGPVVSWSWNFGDGSTSTSQNPSHTYNAAGNFTARLTVNGSSGQTSSASRVITVTNAPAPLPAITVVASQPLASILSAGVFTITRGGGTSSALTVNYSLGGSAVNGADYQTLSGSAVIPAGSSSTRVVVQPKGLLTVLKTVVLTLSPRSSYTVGSPNSATVTIVVQAGGGLL